MSKALRDLQLRASEKQSTTIDGLPRPRDEEERLNALFRTVFSGPSGREALEHLQSITTQTVMLPSVSDAELRHMEGMRALAAIITRRALSEKG